MSIERWMKAADLVEYGYLPDFGTLSYRTIPLDMTETWGDEVRRKASALDCRINDQRIDAINVGFNALTTKEMNSAKKLASFNPALKVDRLVAEFLIEEVSTSNPLTPMRYNDFSKGTNPLTVSVCLYGSTQKDSPAMVRIPYPNDKQPPLFLQLSYEDASTVKEWFHSIAAGDWQAFWWANSYHSLRRAIYTKPHSKYSYMRDFSTERNAVKRVRQWREELVRRTELYNNIELKAFKGNLRSIPAQWKSNRIDDYFTPMEKPTYGSARSVEEQIRDTVGTAMARLAAEDLVIDGERNTAVELVLRQPKRMSNTAATLAIVGAMSTTAAAGVYSMWAGLACAGVMMLPVIPKVLKRPIVVTPTPMERYIYEEVGEDLRMEFYRLFEQGDKQELFTAFQEVVSARVLNEEQERLTALMVKELEPPKVAPPPKTTFEVEFERTMAELDAPTPLKEVSPVLPEFTVLEHDISDELAEIEAKKAVLREWRKAKY